MSADRDAVDRYLEDLATRLHGPAGKGRRVVAELEAHLHDAVDAHCSAGLDPGDAQAAALADFGSARQVAAAVNQAAWSRASGPVLRAVAGMLVRLAAAGLVVMGIAAGAARLVAALTSTQTVYGLPAGAQMPAASCAHWLGVQPQATTCQQAGTLEASVDLTASLALAGVLGVLLWATIAVVYRAAPQPSAVLPRALAPAIAMAGFAAAAAALAVLAADDAVLSQAWGAGPWWTTAACSALAALVCAWLLIRALSRTGRVLQKPAPAHG